MTPVDMDTRIAERRKQVRRERMFRRRRRTLVLLAIAAVAATAYAIERSPLVELAAVQVTGTEQVDPAAIRDAAALPLGTSTLRLDLAGADARVEAMPQIRDADVRRVDPLTVRITVVERRPVVAVNTDRGALLVDEEGVIVERGTRPDLPTIVAPAKGLPEPGDHLRALPAAWNAFVVHQGLPGPLRTEVVRYEATSPDDVDVILTGDLRARFGRATAVPEKARVLGALLGELPEERPLTLDIRAPSNPVIAPH